MRPLLHAGWGRASHLARPRPVLLVGLVVAHSAGYDFAITVTGVSVDQIVTAEGLRATYPATAFGLAAGTEEVTMTAAEGPLPTIHYETTVSGRSASVDTTFSPRTDPTAVVRPA